MYVQRVGLASVEKETQRHCRSSRREESIGTAEAVVAVRRSVVVRAESCMVRDVRCGVLQRRKE
jgi:hypothetical protein